MPDTQPGAAKKGVVAMVLMVSAAVLICGAVLAYTGLLPVQAEIRPMIATALGLAGVMDFVIGLWFFRMSRSV
jgi:hypothetical protein